MATSWKITVNRASDRDLLIGYSVDISIYSTIDFRSSIINLPSIVLVDSIAKNNKYIDILKDRCQVLFYDDFTIGSGTFPDQSVISTLQPRMTHSFEETYVLFSMKNDKVRRFRNTDDRVRIPGILLPAMSLNSGFCFDHITTASDYEIHTIDPDEYHIMLQVQPKHLSSIDTEEKEKAFTRKLSIFMYNNIVIHLVDALNSISNARYDEPVIEGKVYTRTEILSTITDPFGYTTNIVINKKDQPKYRGNLDYTRKIRVNKIREGEYHEENGSSGNKE